MLQSIESPRYIICIVFWSFGSHDGHGISVEDYNVALQLEVHVREGAQHIGHNLWHDGFKRVLLNCTYIVLSRSGQCLYVRENPSE